MDITSLILIVVRFAIDDIAVFINVCYGLSILRWSKLRTNVKSILLNICVANIILGTLSVIIDYIDFFDCASYSNKSVDNAEGILSTNTNSSELIHIPKLFDLYIYCPVDTRKNISFPRATASGAAYFSAIALATERVILTKKPGFHRRYFSGCKFVIAVVPCSWVLSFGLQLSENIFDDLKTSIPGSLIGLILALISFMFILFLVVILRSSESYSINAAMCYYRRQRSKLAFRIVMTTIMLYLCAYSVLFSTLIACFSTMRTTTVENEANTVAVKQCSQGQF